MSNSTAVSFGPLTYQVWNRNLERKVEAESKREQIQIKWGKLYNTLLEITSRREEYKQSGTFEGNMSEKSSVIYFNRDPENSIFSNYLNELHCDSNKVLMIRVTTKQYSKLSNQKVMTRADAYAIKVLDDRIFNLLEANGFYLDEDILSNYQTYYEKLNNSGVSIKKDLSNSYQILKLTPNSFKELFGNYELGCGASLFCLRQDKLNKNIQLIDGWHTTIEKMSTFFELFVINEEKLTHSIELCKEIKNFSTNKIKEKIDSSPALQKIIFNGIGIYEEPYSAYFFMQNNELHTLKYLPFTVTTGSGRSHDDYSLVLKPTNSNLNIYT